MSFSICKSIVL